MNKLTQPEPFERVREGGILYFDARFGCAGDMLIGALLDLGLQISVLERAFELAGLDFIAIRKQTCERGGIEGTRVSFLDPNGVPLQTAPSQDARKTRRSTSSGQAAPLSKRTSRLPMRSTKETHRSETNDAHAVISMPVAALSDATDGPTASQPEHGRISSSSLTAERFLNPKASLTLGDIRDVLQQSQLEVLPLAMAQKTLQTLMDGYGHVVPTSPSDLAFPGRVSLDLLCDIIGFSALIADLSPLQITSSPIGVSPAPVEAGFKGHEKTIWPGPSPVVLQMLRQAPVLENDFEYECTTPTGAALLATFTQHFGTRLPGTYGLHGVGLGTSNILGRSNCVRASYAHPLHETTSTDSAQAMGTRQRWVIELPHHIDIQQLFKELTQMGADDLIHHPNAPTGSTATSYIEFILSAGAEEPITRFLFQQSQAISIRRNDITQIKPLEKTATVMVGEGKKKIPIQLTIRYYAGECIGVEVDEAALQRAAQRSGVTKELLRAEAIVKWQTLQPSPISTRAKNKELIHE